MYVTATVDAGTIRNAFAVPDSAVLRDTENQPFVYVETCARKFGRRSVTLGESQDGKTANHVGIDDRRPLYWKWQLVSRSLRTHSSDTTIELQQGTMAMTVGPVSE